jgi:hypothetical protein
MRNFVLAAVAVASLTFAAMPSAFAVGVCDRPNLDDCPIYEVYPGTMHAWSYQVPQTRDTRRARIYHGAHTYHG